MGKYLSMAAPHQQHVANVGVGFGAQAQRLGFVQERRPQPTRNREDPEVGMTRLQASGERATIRQRAAQRTGCAQGVFQPAVLQAKLTERGMRRSAHCEDRGKTSIMPSRGGVCSVESGLRLEMMRQDATLIRADMTPLIVRCRKYGCELCLLRDEKNNAVGLPCAMPRDSLTR